MSDSHTNEDGAITPAPHLRPGTPALPHSIKRGYRPALFLVFFACLLWLILVGSQRVRLLPLSSETVVLLGLVVPILAAFAILYFSGLFRGMRPAARACVLFLAGAGLHVVALGLWFAGMFTYPPAKGLFYRTFRTPSVLRASFIEDFDRQHAAAQRQKLVGVFQSKHGSYGLRRFVGSIEGTIIGQCLVVEDGRLTMVDDYTRDSYGNREFVIRYPTNVILAPVEAVEEHAPFTPPQGRIVLKYYLKTGGVFYF